MILYYYPRIRGVAIAHELIRQLLQTHSELIAGLKDSTGEWPSIKAYIEGFPDLAIFPGSDAQILSTHQTHGQVGKGNLDGTPAPEQEKILNTGRMPYRLLSMRSCPLTTN